jgi:hypothetical protein
MAKVLFSLQWFILIPVEHFGWPDHSPPPFEYIEPILESIHTHLSSSEKATAVLHCKGTNFTNEIVNGNSWERPVRDDSCFLSYYI